MNYLIQIFTAAGEYDGLSAQEQEAISQEYFAISDVPGVMGGAQLQPASTATTVRVQDGRTLTTDGPFAETKEALMGIYVVDCASLDEVLEAVDRLDFPTGVFEIRPLLSFEPGQVTPLPAGSRS